MKKLPLKQPLPKIEHLPEGAESTMDIPSKKNCFLKKAYEGLQYAVSKLLKTSNPDWVLYDFAAAWVIPIALTLQITRMLKNNFLEKAFRSSHFRR